jgi:hypothetical protein
MYITDNQQDGDNEAWLQDRVGVITGTKAQALTLLPKPIDLESKTNAIEVTNERIERLKQNVKELTIDPENVAKKREQAKNWKDRANEWSDRLKDAKTDKQQQAAQEKIDKFLEKSDDYIKQAEELKSANDRRAEELNKQIAKAEIDLKKAQVKFDEAEEESKRLNPDVGFWKWLAETLADEPDGENPIERGHRLENDNAKITIDKLTEAGIDLGAIEMQPTMWKTDKNGQIGVSPDVCEAGANPRWAIECKSLASYRQLMAVVPFICWEIATNIKVQSLDVESDTTAVLDMAKAVLPKIVFAGHHVSGFDFIPNEFQRQIIQYFVVNPNLQVLYFSMFDPRIHSDLFAHQYMTVRREAITNKITEQIQGEENSLRMRSIITMLGNSTVDVRSAEDDPEF